MNRERRDILRGGMRRRKKQGQGDEGKENRGAAR
jgi:hypothetical protein